MAEVTNLASSIQIYLRAFFIPDNGLYSRQKWILGLINLAAVVIFWVMSSFLVNSLVEDDTYRKPFFITYINTGCFSFYLISYLKFENLSISQFIEKFKQDYDNSCIKYHKQEDEEGLVSEYGSNDNLSGLQQSIENSDSTNSTNTTNELHIVDSNVYLNDEEIGIYETMKLSIQFIILWFSANLVTNASLSYTSVASQTILSSTSSFFTMIIGYLYAVEKINQNKLVGILLSFTGVLIVTKIDISEDQDNNVDNGNNNLTALWGNLLALSGALIYGIYTILLKHKITIKNSYKERNLNTHLFFGFVGIFCLIFLWPIIIILHFTKVEVFEIPHTSQVTYLLLINAFITFVSDFCWCRAVLLTSPLTVTVGLSMTIPLAMIGDWVLKEFVLNWWYIFGAAVVTVGFLIINKDEEEDFVRD
ncbi:hypothetical protein DFJ63DRAFT_310868 [Scheffersomyces coipomensis]|uniref:uncharacterized protein n=1 Tax=Scheffersomyces coipomensis TaxID=1788519 RepID=UPI00315D7D7E